MDCQYFSLPDDLREDFLICAVCLDHYRSPKILPCLHSFCQQCLQHLVKDKLLTCPECRMIVHVVDGVSSLKNNSFIGSLLELFNSKHATNLECAVCSMSQKALAATSRCLDCRAFLCQTCAQGHCCSHHTHDHKVVDLKEFLTGQHDAEARLCQQVYCQVHQQEPLKFFCETCNTPICMDCSLLTNCQHQVLSMAQVVLKKRPEVKALIEGLEMNISKIAEEEQEVERTLATLRAKAEQYSENIKSCVDKAIAHLLSQKEATIRELDMFIKENMEQCRSVKRELQSQREKAVNTIEISQKVFKWGKDFDIMNMEGLMREQIHELQVIKRQTIEINVPELVVGWEQEDLSKMTFTFNMEKPVPIEANVPPSNALPSRVCVVRGGLSLRGWCPSRECPVHTGSCATRANTGASTASGISAEGRALRVELHQHACADSRVESRRGAFLARTSFLHGRLHYLRGGPAVRGARGLRGSPAVRGARGLRGSPAVCGARGLRGSPAVRGARGLRGSPAVRGARGLRGSPAVRGARGLRGSPAVRGARGLRGSPVLWGARGLRSRPAVRGARGLRGSPAVRGARGMR